MSWKNLMLKLRKSKAHKKQRYQLFMEHWNSKVEVGKMNGVVDPYGWGIRNDRTIRFVELCQENTYCYEKKTIVTITNTWLKYLSDAFAPGDPPKTLSHHKKQIDYIAVNSRFRKSILIAKH